MPLITVGEITKEYEEGISLLEISKDFQHLYEFDILLAQINGKLGELHKRVEGNCTVEFITGKDAPGIQTYQRSATLLMLRAFYDVAGSDKVTKLSVEFSIGKGFYVNAKGDFDITEELLSKVKLKMQALVEQNIPIMKRSVNTDDAIELFHRHKMYDKERLFKYRRVSRVNIYSIGGFEDYYYGYMVQSTGYIKCFDLIPYDEGFVLLLPQQSNPKVLPGFAPQAKLFQVLKESLRWGETLKVANVGALNEAVSQGRINDLILIQEALQEKKIAEIAEEITKQHEKKFVMIAGPSSSGKTTFSHRLSIQLRAQGKTPHPIAVDDYFIDREKSPKDENGNYNFEVLECLDIKQFNEDMTNLLDGKTVELPKYNFIIGKREYKGEYLTLGENDILVIEGIHCLNEKLSYSLPKENKFKIYISALTQLNVDEHNRIPTTDGRLIRRMVRDARTRGSSAQDTIHMWPNVRKGEEEYIFPFQEDVDVMFNSTAVYELAVLKPYAEPLLFGIPRDSKEYLEAKRLLKFLDYFLSVGSENLPQNSILREFVGGSCFRV